MEEIRMILLAHLCWTLARQLSATISLLSVVSTDVECHKAKGVIRTPPELAYSRTQFWRFTRPGLAKISVLKAGQKTVLVHI
ncbi:hypothetical protein J3R30DRAFT_3507351 [Lentinula aciculospora]|uniref:Secreted protein n=1 Tax=Lentinula aciculospora TaxID=153920 RepID=A0A9W9A5Y7_9AGAR|nr:hypothetical protein J3R30DRAFT_3507351 [Lentinula aciculospora]